MIALKLIDVPASIVMRGDSQVRATGIAIDSRLVEPGRAQQADEQHQPPFAAQPALLDRAAHRRAVTSKPCCADQVAITLLPNGISESTCH